MTRRRSGREERGEERRGDYTLNGRQMRRIKGTKAGTREVMMDEEVLEGIRSGGWRREQSRDKSRGRAGGREER